MHVVKRDGSAQKANWHAVTQRIARLCAGRVKIAGGETIVGAALHEDIQAVISQAVIARACNGITTRELDIIGAHKAASKLIDNPEYGVLAARLTVSNLHKETSDSFSETFAAMHAAGLMHDDAAAIVAANAAALDAMIVHTRDYDYDYFGLCTLQKSYLKKIKGKIVERPQYMCMREALQDHGADLKAVAETYEALSRRIISNATPKKHNSCTPKPQLASCNLISLIKDSIAGIYDTMCRIAQMSKWGAGIGLSIHDLRAAGTYIPSTDGFSNGIVPMLQVVESTSKYVAQGGGKRKGAVAIYLEPWHAEIEAFLDLRRETGSLELRAPRLFCALWVPDLFFRRAAAGENWTLFCPYKAPGLANVYGDEFDALYERYELEGRGNKTIKARDLMRHIVEVQIETGGPYLHAKDACNRKSNQKNLGTIRSSNLCCEVIQYTAPDEIAVCNLGSINLKEHVAFSANGKPYMDFAALRKSTMLLVRNINKSIDKGFVPVTEGKTSNERHRPMGIGVAGFADALCLLRLPYESLEAQQVNKLIFEHMYQAAVIQSARLAEKEGPYSSYEGSPMHAGKFQFDLWDVKPQLDNWDQVRDLVARHGVRNSLLIAPMPTASTSQIMGVAECFEPFFSNHFSRKTMSGPFEVINTYLVQDLQKLGLYTREMGQAIMAERGSIQNIPGIPDDLKRLYKTVWEIPTAAQLQMAADRGAFVDQACSQNVYYATISTKQMVRDIMRGWRLGLKCISYYTSVRPGGQPVAVTVQTALPPVALRATSEISSDGCGEFCST